MRSHRVLYMASNLGDGRTHRRSEAPSVRGVVATNAHTLQGLAVLKSAVPEVQSWRFGLGGHALIGKVAKVERGRVGVRSE